MALIQNTGMTPTGTTVPIPVAGLVASTLTPLAANGVFATDVLPYKGNDSIHFSIVSDQVGSYSIEYYKDGSKINFQGNTVVFDPAVVSSFQGALAGKGDSFKIIYTNGATAQGIFYLEVRFGDISQQTQRSLGVPASATNMAGTTHAVVEARTNGVGNYNQVTGTLSGAKYAQDVYVVNPSSTPTDFSTDTTLKAVLAKLGMTLQVAGTFYQAVQPISGNVGINGTVPVTGAFYQAIQPVSGTVSINGTVPVSGSFYQSVQPVSGTVAVNNFPASLSGGTTGSFMAISLAANVQQTIAANAARKQVIISSTSGTILIGVGFTATANNWSYRIITNGTLEIDAVAAALGISLFSTAASTVNVTQII